MKVIKRDGRIVEFDKKKITIAIEQANLTVNIKEKAKPKEIEKIIDYIEKLDRKRILVEDIQDIIEMKLMEYKHYELAKRYIVYRYNRALIRRQNTTDETILGLIRQNNTTSSEEKNKNKTNIAAKQRNLIAAEVSKDLSKRLLLPEKINKAHEEGILYFHDSEYFLQPIFGSCLLNINDMLEKGTVINNIQVKPPTTFQEACNRIAEILISAASSEYGEISIELKYLGKYLNQSRKLYQRELIDKYKDQIPDNIIKNLTEEKLKKELKTGVYTLQHHLNLIISLITKPKITYFLYLDENDPFIEENAIIYEELLSQRYEDIKNEEGISINLEFPKLLYVLDINNNLSGGTYDYITKLALKCVRMRKSPYFISAKKIKEIWNGQVHSPIGSDIFPKLYKKEDKYLFEGRFHQGFVTLNIGQIALLSEQSEEKFYDLLKERLELCFEALMCRHYALLGTLANMSPIHYCHGAVARIPKNQKIDNLLKAGYSFLSLGYIGLQETVQIMTQESLNTKTGIHFASKLLTYLKKTTDKWEKQTGISFHLYNTTSPKIATWFQKIDEELESTQNLTYSTNFELEMIESDSNVPYILELQQITPGIKYHVKEDTLKWKENELISFLYENVIYTIIE